MILEADKAEAAHASVLRRHHLGTDDGAELGEDLAQALIVDRHREVLDVDVGELLHFVAQNIQTFTSTHKTTDEPKKAPQKLLLP